MVSRQALINRSIPEVDIRVGTYSATNADGTVQVDFGQGEITVLPVGVFHRTPGEQVRALRVNDTTVVIGPAVEAPSTGVVTSVGATQAVISTVAGSLSLPWVGAAPSASDVVAIVGGWILGEASEAPTSGYAPPGVPGSGGTFSLEFRAADSGSYFGGSWWTNDVRCSSGNIGAWFYGSTVADSIPDSATILSVEVYVTETRNQFPASLATIGTHTLQVKSGSPSVTGAVTVPPGSGWKSLPTAFGDEMKTGAAWGLGTDEGGFHVFAGTAADANSGLLRISYTV